MNSLSYSKAALFGILAGLAMAIVAMMTTAILGMGLWAMPSMIAGLILGPSAAMSAGVGVILIGLMLHMLFSMMFGVIYAAAVNLGTHEYLITGAALGIALWFVNFHLMGRFIPAAQFMAAHEPNWLAIMTHLIFGLALGVLATTAKQSPMIASAAHK